MIQLEATTSCDFHSAVTNVSSIIMGCGGWVTDHKFFSNIMAMMAFELPATKLACLVERLNRANISTSALQASPVLKLHDIQGQITIRFLHNKPDVRRIVPAFDL